MRSKAGRRCAGIRGKRLAIVCTAGIATTTKFSIQIGDSEVVEEA
jgi:hypothetical protein